MKPDDQQRRLSAHSRGQLLLRAADFVKAIDYAILTFEANPDVARYQERQGAVLLRRHNTDWLDLKISETDLLKPLPARSFDVEEIGGIKGKAGKPGQKLLAL